MGIYNGELIIDNGKLRNWNFEILKFWNFVNYTILLVLIIDVNIRNTSYPERVTYNNDGWNPSNL